MRAALCALARVSTLVVAVGGVQRGIRTLTAAIFRAHLICGTVDGCCARGCFGHTPLMRIARITVGTFALELARCVETLGVLAARRRAAAATTLVYVRASYARVARVTWRTRARVRALRVVAHRKLAALSENSKAPIALVDVLAIAIRVARVTARTMAAIRARHVGALRALAAQARRAIVGVALVDVDTAELDVVRVKREARLAHARGLLAVRLARCVLAAVDAVARRLTAERQIRVDGYEAVVAGALERAVRVEAAAVGPTHWLRRVALVDVATLGGGRASDKLLVALFALALVRAVRVDASGLSAAQRRRRRRRVVLLLLLLLSRINLCKRLCRCCNARSQRALVDIDALDAVDLIAELALAGRVEAQGVARAIVITRATNVDGRTLAAHLGRAARHELVGTRAFV